jgi:hypothetical protein
MSENENSEIPKDTGGKDPLAAIIREIESKINSKVDASETVRQYLQQALQEKGVPSDKELSQKELDELAVAVGEVVFKKMGDYSKENQHFLVRLKEIEEELLSETFDTIEGFRGELAGGGGEDLKSKAVSRYDGLSGRINKLTEIINQNKEKITNIDFVGCEEFFQDNQEKILFLQEDVKNFISSLKSNK